MRHSFYSRHGKPLFDSLLAAIALIALSPLFLLASIAILIFTGAPIFFRQARAGQFGVPFTMLKFRTMTCPPPAANTARAAAAATRITAAGDPRITPIGRILRRTKIDELPQLLNVLQGHMSLVGPRPELLAIAAAYTERQKQVLQAKPGITSLASIAFAREEEILAAHSDPEAFYLSTILPAKLDLDLAYSRNIRFATDLTLLVRTVAAIFDFKHSTAPPFQERALPQPSRGTNGAVPIPRTQATMSDSLPLSPFLKASSSSTLVPKPAGLRFDPYSRTNQFILESFVFAFSLVAAYAIRFEGWPAGHDRFQLLLWLPVLVLARIAVHYAMGACRIVWRFISLSDAIEIAKSIGVVTLALLAVRLLSTGSGAFAELVRIPLSVIALEGLLSLTGSLGIRALRRIHYNHQRRVAVATERPPRRVLLYGAGRAGILLQRELETNNSYDVIGFIDDDPRKLGSVISRTRILGSGDDLAEMVAKWSVHEVVISMATASRQTLIRILAKCRQANVPAKIIPSLREIFEQRTPISQLREPRAEELLGREHVETLGVASNTRSVYANRRILVTGAGGSIGSELVRQLAALSPASIAVLDKDENSVFELEQELLRRSAVSIVPLIADVRDSGRLRALFADFRPEIVFHAAAHKHVPLMERHPCEAILNNVVGTRNVLEVVADAGIDRFVFISSDKAVNPANIMGATKRIGELLVQSFAAERRVRSACVRFGNVLGSRGSVLPLFQRQIAEGGPVTVTHPDVVRYFMTIQEAVQLILCAGTLANAGEIFVLDMGTPRNILELAHEMILLSGLTPGADIQTSFTGLRPGEKLYEELSTSAETLTETKFDKLSVIETTEVRRDLGACLLRLADAAASNDQHRIYKLLSEMDLGFTAQMPKVRAAAAASL